MEEVMEPYGATEHWAKIEVDHFRDLEAVRLRLAARYPVTEFNSLRRRLDPNNILSNRIVNELFPLNE
jgi:hypothetical protein